MYKKEDWVESFEEALDRYATLGPMEPKELSQADELRAKVLWGKKITTEDLYDQLGGCLDSLDKAIKMNNLELIALVILKVKEVYAERLALEDIYGHGQVQLPEVQKECSKLVAEYSLKKQGVPI
jgi:hypothetical protein